MVKSQLSSAAVHRLLEKAGAARVGDDAVEALKRVLEEVAIRVGREAWELSKHAGRKTLKEEDITLVVKRIIRELYP